jgi:beta-xylosidase
MPIVHSIFRGCAVALLAIMAGAATAEPLFVPVYRTDFPDPHIIENHGEYLAYSTNSAGINLPMASSRDLVAWTEVKDPAKPNKAWDAMPELASWVKEGRTWAPEVIAVGGRWLLYYTANDRKKDLQCVGVASAADPRGPFRDLSAQPLVCQEALGGTIDAHPFRDSDGKLYLYYKSDGNRIGKPAELWGQPLAADGMSLTGQPVSLERNDQPWEAGVVESPTMARTPAGYTLLYSAHYYGWQPEKNRLSPYAMGYATCRTPLGPCTDSPENPILHSFNDKKAGCLSGPGHQTVFQAGGRSYIAFHAWAATPGCRKLDEKRFLYIAPLGWNAAGKPMIAPSLRPAGR